ncbi:hypothetical protein [Microbulbifer aggregans]|uniref:hypothetical protein n=1 Tax=Microbulbifer aggregans TaxID=1769779 RepID=UPI0011AB573E|nr:hypothetical protein [Microbulbifer aggregans]
MENEAILSERSKCSKAAITVLVAMFIAGLLLWLLLAPVEKGSVVFWSGVVLMAIPGYVAGESLGSLGLGADFVKKLSKSLRIIFGFSWVLICLLIFSAVLAFLSSMVGT